MWMTRLILIIMPSRYRFLFKIRFAIFLFSLILNRAVLASSTPPDQLALFLKGAASVVDIDNDGLIDFRLTVHANEKIIDFTPSWNKSFRSKKIFSGDRFSLEVYHDNLLQEKTITSREPQTGKYINRTQLLNFNQQAHPTLKIVWNYFQDQKYYEKQSYQFKKSSWNELEKETHPFQLHLSAQKQCYRQLVVPEIPEFLKVFPSSWQSYISPLLDTQFGIRVDASTCGEASLDVLDQAIDLIVNTHLKCLREVRPDLVAALVDNIASNKTIVKCQSHSGTNYVSTSNCNAFTYSQLDADITLCGIDPSEGILREAEDLSSTLLHELLHHHIKGCPNHAKGDVRDAINGCANICSGNLEKMPYEASAYFNWKISKEGCLQCISSPQFHENYSAPRAYGILKERLMKVAIEKHGNTNEVRFCQESTYFKAYEECKQANKGVACGPNKLMTFKHPLIGACLKLYPRHAAWCELRKNFEIFGTEAYTACLKNGGNRHKCVVDEAYRVERARGI